METTSFPSLQTVPPNSPKFITANGTHDRPILAVQEQLREYVKFRGGMDMELLDLTATIHIDTAEIDAAIEKAKRLLALLKEAKETAGSQNKKS